MEPVVERHREQEAPAGPEHPMAFAEEPVRVLDVLQDLAVENEVLGLVSHREGLALVVGDVRSR